MAVNRPFIIHTLALSVFVLTLGCGAGEGSSEGMSWQIVFFGLRETANPEQVQKATERFREISSNLSEIEEVERYEWGELLKGYGGQSHCLLVTLRDPTDPHDLSGDLHRSSIEEGFHAVTVHITNVHDATPSARGSTRGHLRRIMLFPVGRGDVERASRLEEVMAELPSKIPAIERLQWGTEAESEATKRRSTVRWCVLLTFADEAGRDACLADPAYKEFEEMYDRLSLSEYIATDSWSGF